MRTSKKLLVCKGTGCIAGGAEILYLAVEEEVKRLSLDVQLKLIKTSLFTNIRLVEFFMIVER